MKHRMIYAMVAFIFYYICQLSIQVFTDIVLATEPQVSDCACLVDGKDILWLYGLANKLYILKNNVVNLIEN